MEAEELPIRCHRAFAHPEEVVACLHWSVESNDEWNRQGQTETLRLLQKLDGSMLRCGHNVCFGCHQVIMECPLCKGSVTRVGPNIAVCNLSRKLEATCAFECEFPEKVTVDDVLTHLKTTCPYVKVACPNEGCTTHVPREGLQSHRDVCGYGFDERCRSNLEAVLEAGEPSGGLGPAQDDQNAKETCIDTLETFLDTIPNPQQGTQPQHHHLQQAAPVTQYRRIAPKPLPAAPPVFISLHSPSSTFVPLISPPATMSPGLIPLLPNGPIFTPITNQSVMMGSFGGIHSFHPYHLNPPIAMASPRPINWVKITYGGFTGSLVWKITFKAGEVKGWRRALKAEVLDRVHMLQTLS
ncbi:RNF151 [Branchiostoma lanceolatum]|uniref:RNF151 protein n=1 Tax=Branchiostoma lanceolatum TaxID=7740 RepID=A0A8K0E5A1_BRALA|nr:RNF151 [Branchiostoma lanceolatum]